MLNWNEAVEELAARRGVVLLVGATDVGKSTLTLEAANAAVRAGRRAGILDTDLGQGEIGPPGTLGIVRLEEPVASLAAIKPRALAFVGDTSPYGHFLTVIQAARKMADHGLARGDDVVFVDTSGVVAGRLAEKLKLAKLAVLDPAVVVCVHREAELERLARLLGASTAAEVLHVQSPPEVRLKSAVYRRLQRSLRMRRHFDSARRVEVDAGQVQVFDAWLYTGRPLPARQLQVAAQALKVGVPHGEVTADGVFLCVDGRPDRAGFLALAEEFGRQRVAVTPVVALQNLLVGLVGAEGRLLDVALLQGINFERAVLSLLTPTRSLTDVRIAHFGRLRVRPDGSEIARLRPSDL